METALSRRAVQDAFVAAPCRAADARSLAPGRSRRRPHVGHCGMRWLRRPVEQRRMQEAAAEEAAPCQAVKVTDLEAERQAKVQQGNAASQS